MARPRSDEKQEAILSAAARVVGTQGLSAATAAIAKEAGVSNGSLFTYFETKADLLNRLFLELKTEMATAALADMPARGGIRPRALHVWRNWLHWGAAFPEKRRALARLNLSDDITAETHQAGHEAMRGFAELVEQSRKSGPLKKEPLQFVMLLVNAVAETTMDFMISDPKHADKHCDAAFDGLWRMLG